MTDRATRLRWAPPVPAAADTNAVPSPATPCAIGLVGAVTFGVRAFIEWWCDPVRDDTPGDR
jgi:hypothetical protein